MRPRWIELTRGLAGAGEPEARGLAQQLLAGGAAPGALADGILSAAEALAACGEDTSTRRRSRATAAAGLMAMFAGAAGLAALLEALELPTHLAWVPLVPVPLLLLGFGLSLRARRRRRADARERRVVAAARALLTAGAPEDAALDAAAFLAGASTSEVRALLDAPPGALAAALAVRTATLAAVRGERLPRALLPGALAIWAVASFWVLYFTALGLAANGASP